MVKQAQTLNPRRWNARALGRLGLPVVIAVLFSVVVVQVWTKSSDEVDFVATERHGVEYLQPLTVLMSKLVEAQSVAVAGGVPDAAGLREATEAVSGVDQKYGKQLTVDQRWNDARERITQIINDRPSGATAYTSYTDTVQLVQNLIRKIADSSKLVLDSSLDSYYLMEAAVLRLPNVMLFTSRAVDIGVLNPKGSKTEAVGQQQIAVARYQVSLEGDGIAAGLRKALDSTASTSLGPNLTNQFDEFRTAVDVFVPPATMLQSLEQADSGAVATAAITMRDTARKLSASVLSELDKLLKTRSSNASTDRLRYLAIAVFGLLLTGTLLWLILGEARGPQGQQEAGAGGTGTEQQPATRRGRFGLPGRGGPPADADRAAGEGAKPPKRELVNAGRGLRARRRERGDDAR